MVAISLYKFLSPLSHCSASYVLDCNFQYLDKDWQQQKFSSLYSNRQSIVHNQDARTLHSSGEITMKSM